MLLYMRLYDLAGSSALESRKSLDLLKLKTLSHGSYLSQPDTPFPSFFWHKPVYKHAWGPLKQERRSRWSSQTLVQNLLICFLYVYSELTETRALSLVTLGRESKHEKRLKLEFGSRTQRPASCWEVDTRWTLEANCDCIISKFPNIGPQPTDLLNLWTSTKLVPTGISFKKQHQEPNKTQKNDDPTFCPQIRRMPFMWSLGHLQNQSEARLASSTILHLQPWLFSCLWVHALASGGEDVAWLPISLFLGALPRADQI